MPKYYYECPEDALYMAKKHKVRFLGERGQIVALETRDDHVDYMAETFLPESPAYHGKFHVHPDSERIFEPQIGDVVQLKDNHVGYVVEYGEVETAGDRVIGNIENKENGVWYIIQRSGRPFIWPKVVKHD